jgi:hypothetical protein
MLCPACRDALEQKFQEVKNYIRDHKAASLQQVAEDCDVEVGQIRQWLREERLELTEGSANFLTCESCNTPIRSGRYCDKCRNSMANGFQSLIDEGKPAAPAPHKKQEKENPKMRFLQ